ncbi:MAG: dihydroorotate dehydrogenase electron transfer subunit [Syntrophomonadaceae bacterium]|jgi:dihydroorotate dehydrogenase electron transfer subunit
MSRVEMVKVVSNIQVADDMWQMELAAAEMAAACKPGQFVHIRVSDSIDPLLRRPLSVYDIEQERLHLLYKVVGQGTRLLTRLVSNDYVDIMGPLGQGFTLPGKKSYVLLVGGGVGMAPLVYLARRLKAMDCRVTALYGVENKEQLAAADRLTKLGANCQPATMDGSAGYQGIVTGLLQEVLEKEIPDYIYTCGPEVMMAKVAGLAQQYKIPGQVSLEESMACGVGACLGCARKLKHDSDGYVKVCKDGPVFDFEQIDFGK